MDMDILALGYMDIFFFVVVALSIIVGLVSGFIATIFSFICWAGAFAATYFGLQYAQPLMEEYIKNPLGAQIAAAVALFILTFVIIGIINSQILRVTRHLRMGIFDRSLGAAFGFVRGASVVVIFVFSVLLVNSMLISGAQSEKHEGIDRGHKQKVLDKSKAQEYKNKEVEPLWLKKSCKDSHANTNCSILTTSELNLYQLCEGKRNRITTAFQVIRLIISHLTQMLRFLSNPISN